MKSFRAALGVSGLSLGAFFWGTNSSVILNESKRQFYQDDASVVPIPGTIVPAAGTEIEALGKNKIVNGISIRSPSPLEATFSSVRKTINDVYKQAEDKFYNVSTKYYETESKVASQVAQLHEKREDLLPNGIYVIVGTLAGSIFARRRNILLRAITPVAFGLVTFKIFLPETFGNTVGFAWKLEQEKIPKVAETQRNVVSKAEELYKDVESTTESSRAAAQSLLHKSRDYVSQVTGLNLDQKVINGDATTTKNR